MPALRAGSHAAPRAVAAITMTDAVSNAGRRRSHEDQTGERRATANVSAFQRCPGRHDGKDLPNYPAMDCRPSAPHAMRKPISLVAARHMVAEAGRETGGGKRQGKHSKRRAESQASHWFSMSASLFCASSVNDVLDVVRVRPPARCGAVPRRRPARRCWFSRAAVGQRRPPANCQRFT